MNINPAELAPARVNGTGPLHDEPSYRPPSRAERAVADEEAKARRAEIRDNARRARQRREEQWADEREARQEARKTRRTTARSASFGRSMDLGRRLWHAFVLVGAIVGVNVVAVVGQVTAFTAATDANGFGWSMPQALATAAVIESIAIYVGWHAHVALIEGDSVMRLRITSYAIALGVGALNYHHYAPDWQITDTAAMFGAASVLSPWLWAMHSRHVHRAKLREDGMIDPRAPKFSALRWVLHRAETWQALKWAVRNGEQSPGAAIAAVHTDDITADADRLLTEARDRLLTAQATLIRAQSDALVVTEMVMNDDRPVIDEVTGELPAACTPELPPAPSAEGPDPVTSEPADGDQSGDRERPDDQDNRDAEKWIRAAMRRGRTPKLADVRKKFPYSHGWAQLRVRAARDELTAEGYRFLPGNVVQPPTNADTSDDHEVTGNGSSDAPFSDAD